jgi:hypothetical protein
VSNKINPIESYILLVNLRNKFTSCLPHKNTESDNIALLLTFFVMCDRKKDNSLPY